MAKRFVGQRASWRLQAPLYLSATLTARFRAKSWCPNSQL